MKLISKIFIPLISLFSCAVVGTGVYFGVQVVKLNDRGLIQLKNENTSVFQNCDLGVISPGEVKEQSYTIESLVNKDVSLSISFKRRMYKLSYDYVSIDASLGDEKLDKVSFSSCFESPLVFENKIKKNESKKLVVRYTLTQDIPKEIIGTSLDFIIVLETGVYSII